MIGVYGGTFNPVHFGHLRTALEVRELFNLQQLRLLPCNIPAHREQPQVSGEMRLQMLALAIADTPELQLDRRELDRPGASYMVETLCSLRMELADTPLLLFVGADAFAGLSAWYQWQRLFDYAHVVVMTRPGYQFQAQSTFYQDRLVEDRQMLSQSLHGFLYFQAVTHLDISASQVRQIIASGRNPQFLLPESVRQFILHHQLYQAF